MPHVASALKNLAANRPLAARPAPASDRAPPAPFASLFDDNAPAPERAPQSAAADKGGRAARSDQAQAPGKSTDSKTAKAKDDVKSTDAGKDAKADQTEQAPGDGKTEADATIAAAKTTDKTTDKTGLPTDGKAADTLVAADAAIAPPSDTLPAMPTAEATVTALVPTTGTVAATAAAGNAATIATPAKVDALAVLQAGTGKAGNDTALTAKAAAQPHDAAKPPGPAGDAAGKDAIAQARDELARGKPARGELADAAHHAATPQAQAALAADTMTAAPKGAADAAPPTALTVPPPTTAPAGPPTAAGAPLPPPVAIPFACVAFEIAGKALAGKNHFEIRLDPPELGRIEVRLDVDRDGNVTSRMIADRTDTLDLLRRDASGLERALQDAGLKTSDNGLQFSLRDQSAQQQSGNASDIARLLVEDETLPATDTTARSYSRLAGLGSGVDIHV